MRPSRILFCLVALVVTMVVLAACRNTEQEPEGVGEAPPPAGESPAPAEESPSPVEEVGASGGGAQASPTVTLPAPVLNGNIPFAVPAHPSQSDPTNARPWFDIFSWQNFIALNWPSDPNAVGQPLNPDDPAMWGNYESGGPVWTTWKTAYELFPGPGATPVAWDDQSSATAICENFPEDDRLVFDRFTKFDTVIDGIDEAFAGPLPDQTGEWTMYSIHVDQAEYDFVRDNGYYDQSNWPVTGTITMPASLPSGQLGSIEVKASWRDLTSVPADQQSRFFTVDTLVVDPATCTGDANAGETYRCQCSEALFGLVGLHIAHKTEASPQWVWATFEHVNNVEAADGFPASYYNPEGAPTATPGFSYQPAANAFLTPGPATPVNVMRVNPIPDTPPGNSTVDLNSRYQQLFGDTVWQNYQLVMTQWPSDPSAPPVPMATPGDVGCDWSGPDEGVSKSSGAPFPPCGVANTTLETYLQNDSCMNCHFSANEGPVSADFSWILLLRSVRRAATATPAP